MASHLKSLLLCDYRSDGAATVREHIDALRLKSRHKVYMLSIFGELPPNIDLRRFDVLMIHYSLVAAYDAYLSPMAREVIRCFRGLKVMFIQDEYRWVNDTVSVMQYMGIDLLFSCVPEAEIEKVYSKDRLPKLKTVNVFTGYVDNKLLQIDPIPYALRTFDVGYRARKISAWYGDLGREKWLIAERFIEDSMQFELRCDISYFEADRLYGQAWIDFIRSCRAIIGVESGASVFDFTGEIQRKVEAHERKEPGVSFETLREMYFKGLDGKIRVNQVSPRCFEAAALKTMMILYEGEYSGCLKSWRHYVPLRKDHSNMEEVVAALKDETTWQRITSTAYEEVALNRDYSFDAFAVKVDNAVEDAFDPGMRSERLAYSAEEFLEVADAVNQRKPMQQARSLGGHVRGMIDTYGRKYLSGQSRELLLNSMIWVYRSMMRARVKIAKLHTASRWYVGPSRLPLLTLVLSRLKGYNLVEDIEALRMIQTAGRIVYRSTGVMPFTMDWSPTNSTLLLRRASVDLGDRQSVENGDGMIEAIRKGAVREFRFLFDSGGRLPPYVMQSGGTFGGFLTLIQQSPTYAERLLFGGADDGKWCTVCRI